MCQYEIVVLCNVAFSNIFTLFKRSNLPSEFCPIKHLHYGSLGRIHHLNLVQWAHLVIGYMRGTCIRKSTVQ